MERIGYQTLCVLSVALACVSVPSNVGFAGCDAKTRAVDQIVQALEKSPAWADASKDDDHVRDAIAAEMNRLAQNDVDVLRAAIEKYIDLRRRTKDGYDVSSMSKLFLLNRFVFDVPSKVPSGSPLFGGWVGVPLNSK